MSYEAHEFEIKPARYSEMAVMPRLFAHIDFRSLGVHEYPRAANTAAVYESISEIGYYGPAISAFFSLTDEWLMDIDPNTVLEDMPYGVVGIADGHNRHETFRLLFEEGRLRSPLIPIQLVPAHDTELIRFFNHAKPHPEELRSACAYCVGQLALVDECHLDPDLTLEDNSWSFTAQLNDGTMSWIRSAQPDIIIPKDRLFVA